LSTKRWWWSWRRRSATEIHRRMERLVTLDCKSKSTLQYIPLSENQRIKRRMETNDGELWDSLSIADCGADMWIGEKSFL
jgi:hypothetical protein